MKKFLVSLVVVCMISLLAVSAFAYTEATDTWVSSVTCNVTEGTITINTTDAFVTAGAYMFNAAIFNEDKTFPSGDDGFWEVYKRGAVGGDKLVFAKVADYNTDTTYVGGFWGAPAASSMTVTVGDNLEEGKTYYLIMAANSDGANGWSWVNKTFEFTYGEDAQSSADFSVIAYAVAAITGCGALAIAKKR